MSTYRASLVLLLVWKLQLKSAYGSSPVSTATPICNFDDIHAELLKADEMLRKKAELQMSYSAEKQTLLLRQDDDDDDLPYYVPAIAKVVGSVLARNVTSIIEESFGFIPPDINFDIRNILGLVASTITRLNPTQPPPTTAEPLEEGPVVTNTSASSNTTDYEKLFAQALYQLYANQTNSSSPPSIIIINQDTPTGFPPPQETPIMLFGNTDTPQSKNTPELEVPTTTFKYSEGLSITQTTTISSPAADIDVPIYAPAYAPNYNVKSTTKSPIYAPSFGHDVYTTPTTATNKAPSSATSIQPLVNTNSSTTETPTTTTEDDEDYDAIFSSTDAATDASKSTSTTIDPDEDGDDYKS